MAEYLPRLRDLSGVAFVVSSTLAMGLGQRPGDVIASLMDPKSVLLALLVNFVLSPELAIGLSRVIALQPAHAMGLLLMGDSIVFMPLALTLIVPGLQADAWSMAKPLLLPMLVPLAIGFALGPGGGPWVARLLGLAQRVSNLTFVLFVVLVVGTNRKTMADTFGSHAIGTYVLYGVGMGGAADRLGGADDSKRTVFALGAGNRNIAAALVMAGAGFSDPVVTAMLLVASVTGLVSLHARAKVLRPEVVG